MTPTPERERLIKRLTDLSDWVSGQHRMVFTVSEATAALRDAIAALSTPPDAEALPAPTSEALALAAAKASERARELNRGPVDRFELFDDITDWAILLKQAAALSPSPAGEGPGRTPDDPYKSPDADERRERLEDQFGTIIADRILRATELDPSDAQPPADAAPAPVTTSLRNRLLADLAAEGSPLSRRAAIAIRGLAATLDRDPAGASKRLHTLADALGYCDRCEVACDGEDEPVVLCVTCAGAARGYVVGPAPAPPALREALTKLRKHADCRSKRPFFVEGSCPAEPLYALGYRHAMAQMLIRIDAALAASPAAVK